MQATFKTLGILTMPSQNVLSLMEILVNNLTYFSINNEICYKFIKSMKCLLVPEVNL